MLHRLGDRRPQPDLANTLVTKRSDGTFAIAVWNYAEPGATGPARNIHISALRDGPAQRVIMSRFWIAITDRLWRRGERWAAR